MNRLGGIVLSIHHIVARSKLADSLVYYGKRPFLMGYTMHMRNIDHLLFHLI